MAVTGDTQTDHSGIPQNSVIVPGNPTPVLMRGSTNVSTDNNNNTTTPVSFNLEQIGELAFTLGQKIKDGSISVTLASDQGAIPVSLASLPALPTGTNVIGHVIVDSIGNVSISSLPSLPAGTNVIGHIIVDSGTITVNAGTNLNTSLLALESGGNLAAAKADLDTAVTRLTSILSALQGTLGVTGSVAVNTISNYAVESGGNLAAAKADLDTIVTNTNKIPASPATEGGHLAAIDTATAASKTDLDTLVPGVQGWIAATGTGTANQENILTFTQQVRKVVVYNASANNVPLEFDQTAAATSIPIPPGAYWIIDNVLCTTVHIFPSVLIPINTTNGLYVKGWK